ncbi:MAG TPA: aldo/keto reductase [Nitrososphaeraceae archaeon]|nr:aldo/keto reductase [Nitrososphaeraceae archaeon]
MDISTSISLVSEYRAIGGFATTEGTKKYMENAIKNGISNSHFRSFDNLNLSSLGMGTYLGQITSEDNRDLENAIYESVKSGAINVIDTAINYRSMKSEKNIGNAIKRLIEERIISRDQVFISTKNGYITNDGDYPTVDVLEYMHNMFISQGIIDSKDISSGYNVLNPNYIRKCIDKSLTNMQLDTIDLVYVHNAYESWVDDISREEFDEMIQKVFQVYEEYRSSNKIKYYGMATWTCFRLSQKEREYLSLEEMVKIAEKVGGKNHGFRFIQLPYNLVYREAYLLKNQSVGVDNGLTILEASNRLNIGVFTSVPLLQAKLFGAKIPDYLGYNDQLLKIVQITRSTPNVIAPLIGQKKPNHVKENIELAKVAPLTSAEFSDAIKIFD